MFIFIFVIIDMIRRIILFLGLMFVLFFSYRFFNQSWADSLLSKLKNLSFSSKPSSISTGNTMSWNQNSLLSDSLIWWLLKNMTLTGSNVSSGELFNELTWMTIVSDSTWSTVSQTQISNQYTWNTVIVAWLSGKVIVQDVPVETLTVQKSANWSSSNKQKTSSQTLTPQEIREAEMIWSTFSQ